MRVARIATALLTCLVVGCTSSSPSPVAGGGPSTRASTARTPTELPAPEQAPAGIVRLQGCEPRSLLPADAPRSCGQQVLRGLFSPLVELNPANGSPRWGLPNDDAVAASVVSDDASRWRIVLEEGWQFHDGTPVTAASFVDAWNFAAYGPNGQANAFLFEGIRGFDDLHCPEVGCEPVDDTMDGVRVVDEHTIEVDLDRPDRSFPRRLGHVAFSPLPPAAPEDPDAFAAAPVGNGPFRMEGPWQHGERIALRALEDHPSGAPGVDGVDVVLVEDAEQAWAGLTGGRIDVAVALPPTRLAEAGASFEQVVRAGDDYEALVVPAYLSHLADDRLARAFSLAIDRRRLIAQHLAGQARPARGLVPDVVSDGTDRCGALCRFDPAEARALLAEVGMPDDGVELWFDRAGGQEGWVRALAQQLREHLRLEPRQVRVRALGHTSWVAHLQDQRMGGLYPTGWSMDVASAGEYLQELHGPGGLFNFDRYPASGDATTTDATTPSGVDVAEGLATAARAPSEVDAQRAYRQLERRILADMHHIPLWTRTHTAHHSERVAGVTLDGTGIVRLDDLVLTEPS